MTIKCGMLPTRKYVYVKKGEVSKVKACYRKISNILKNEKLADRFVSYLIANERTIPRSVYGEIVLPSFNDRKADDNYTEAELALFEKILKMYDYLDEVTVFIAYEDSPLDYYYRKQEDYVRIEFSALFYSGWPDKFSRFCRFIYKLIVMCWEHWKNERHS